MFCRESHCVFDLCSFQFDENCHYAHGSSEILPRKRISRYISSHCSVRSTEANIDIVYDPNKDVIKMFPYHPLYHNNTQEYDYDKILNKIKQFNTIILLSRKNKKEQTDSMYVVKVKHEGIYDDPWFNAQVDPDDKIYKAYEDFFKAADEVHNRLASDLNLEINYYEDVFFFLLLL